MTKEQVKNWKNIDLLLAKYLTKDNYSKSDFKIIKDELYLRNIDEKDFVLRYNKLHNNIIDYRFSDDDIDEKYQLFVKESEEIKNKSTDEIIDNIHREIKTFNEILEYRFSKWTDSDLLVSKYYSKNYYSSDFIKLIGDEIERRMLNEFDFLQNYKTDFERNFESNYHFDSRFLGNKVLIRNVITFFVGILTFTTFILPIIFFRIPNIDKLFLKAGDNISNVRFMRIGIGILAILVFGFILKYFKYLKNNREKGMTCNKCGSMVNIEDSPNVHRKLRYYFCVKCKIFKTTQIIE